MKILHQATWRRWRHSRDVQVGVVAVVLGAGLLASFVWLRASIEAISQTASSTRPASAFHLQFDSDPALTEQAFATRVFEASNEARAQAGLPPLARTAALEASAKAKLEDMLNQGYWDHVAPDGTIPWAFLDQVGYGYVIAGENLAKEYVTPERAVKGWLNSPSHRANLLAPGYSETGIAVRYSGKRDPIFGRGWIVVAHYATPR